MIRPHRMGVVLFILATGCRPSQAPSTEPPTASVAPALAASDSDAALSPSPTASAAPTVTSSTSETTEGHDPRVALLGTYRVYAHVSSTVSAIGEAEARVVHGSELVFTPALQTPWGHCDAPVWKHRERAVDQWLGDWKAPVLTAAERTSLGLDQATLVTVWEVRCGAKLPSLEIAQTRTDVVVLLHDGVAFAARRQSR